MTTSAAPDAAVELVHRLFVLIKAAAVYGPDNDGYRSHAAAARETLAALLAREDSVRLEAREELLFFNDRPIRFHLAGAASRFLTGEMTRRGIGSLEIRGERGARELDAFVFAFQQTGSRRAGAYGELQRLLRAAGVSAISVRPPEGADESARAGRAAEGAGQGTGQGAAQGQTAPEAARRAFLQAVSVVEDIMTRVRSGREADIGEAKRAVEGLADQVIADAQALFELSMLQNFDEYTYAHCVNVCVYSVAIGDRLGLGRERLSELGFGALFHDVGKARLPKELIDKPDAFDEREWILMRRHPALGAKELLAMRRPLDAALARAASIAFEHHLGMNGQGYPKLPRPRGPRLFSRICAVADAFDAMTSGRVYAKRAMCPDEALRRMVQGAGTAFDPLLLRVFINAAGIYPIGTALLLDTGEKGVVSRNSPADLLHPQVVVFADGRGEKTPPALIDLALQGGRAGEPRRSISGTLDAREHGIDVAEVLRGRPATEPPRPAPSVSRPPAPPHR